MRPSDARSRNVCMTFCAVKASSPGFVGHSVSYVVEASKTVLTRGWLVRIEHSGVREKLYGQRQASLLSAGNALHERAADQGIRARRQAEQEQDLLSALIALTSVAVFETKPGCVAHSLADR